MTTGIRPRTSAVSVLIVDDDPIVRGVLRKIIERTPGAVCVGELGEADSLPEAAERLHPDVVLLDVRMPEMSGIEVLREMRAKGLPCRAVMLTTFDDDEALSAAVREGAKGYLLKDATLEELVGAIREVAAGGTHVRPVVTARVIQGLRELQWETGAGPAGGGGGATEAAPDLTPREVEVLRLMAGGYSNREIAGALGVAEGTVKNHVSSLLGKLGVRDRTRAVLKGLEMGCI